jgi:hypothetical protein
VEDRRYPQVAGCEYAAIMQQIKKNATCDCPQISLESPLLALVSPVTCLLALTGTYLKSILHVADGWSRKVPILISGCPFCGLWGGPAGQKQ